MTRAALVALAVAGCTNPSPLDAPAPVAATPFTGKSVEADVVLRDFRFDSGETLPELKLHYATLGTPQRDAAGHITNAVMILHGTGGSGKQFMRPQFADEMYGPGQPLDITRYFIVLPDDIGHGGSSKPSNGMRAHFPQYAYGDMVRAEHEIAAHLGIARLRLVMGTSMGCMHGFMWAERYPDAMDSVVALACLPVQIAGRNRMWRKLLIDGITNDPEWNHGDYTTPPRASLHIATAMYIIAGSAPVAQQASLPTRDAVDKKLAELEPMLEKDMDPNDELYAVSASRDYDPSRDLEQIRARLVHINFGDDFINPPELGIAEQMIKRVPRGRFVLIPGSAETHGHGTHTWARFWKQELRGLL
jgi:homoserine O-acetyltransferase